MKTINLKSFTTSIALITSLCFSSFVFADEVAIPVIARPAVLQEGTQRELTAEQIAELLPWAKNSKIFLNDLLSSLQGLNSADQVERLVEGIKSVVSESAPKNSELLMRYSLNRSLVLNETLSKEMGSNEVGTVDAKLRVLKLSIQMALKYYDADCEVMSKKQTVQFASYGKGYFSFLTELNKSIFDSSAQYAIQRISLEWLQWDLYRDLNNISYAPQIVKINNGLKIYPAKKVSDSQAVANIRQLKQLIGGLNLNAVKIVESNVNVSSEDSSESSFDTNLFGKGKVDYTSSNFKRCFKLLEKSLSSEAATAECSKEINKSGFDFESSNFNKCYTVYEKSVYSNTAVETCVKEIKKSNFDYTSEQFSSCYVKMEKSVYSNTATTECVKYIQNNPSLDFSGDNFVACYTMMEKSVYSNTAVDSCIDLTKKNDVDFTGRNFKRCYDLKEKSVYSNTALNQCASEISESGFDFLDANFNACYVQKEKSYYSNTAVDKCVSELK